VARIDAIFNIERESEPLFAIGSRTMANGLDAAARLEARQRLSRPLVDSLHEWMLAEHGRMSKHNPVAKVINYMFTKDRWAVFTRFLDDGRICLTNNAAERHCGAWPLAGGLGSSSVQSGAETAPPSCIP
jgi:hypothetical protein